VYVSSKNFEIFLFADLLNKYLTNKIDGKYHGIATKKKMKTSHTKLL